MEIVLYETPNGSCPFARWFDDLSPQAAARVRRVLARLESGNFGMVRGVGAGVFECRIDSGPGYRVYFGRDDVRLVVLLTGGTKRRQQDDIDRAKGFWNDYRQRRRRRD